MMMSYGNTMTHDDESNKLKVILCIYNSALISGKNYSGLVESVTQFAGKLRSLPRPFLLLAVCVIL